MKNFSKWHKKKKKLHKRNRDVYPKQREIWWAALGVNIGNETDGKHKNFERPIVVVSVYGTKTVWGVPVTTQKKTNGEFYYQYELDGEIYTASLTDMRSLSFKRLLRKIGRMSQNDFKRLQERLREFI